MYSIHISDWAHRWIDATLRLLVWKPERPFSASFSTVMLEPGLKISRWDVGFKQHLAVSYQ